jgi:hypothetical protein
MSHASAEFSFVLLYVDNPPASADYYAGLLGKPVLETSPTFAMLPLRDGVMLGLWSKHSVTPVPANQAGASEIDGRQRRCRASNPRRLGQARPQDRAGADSTGLRDDVCRARSGWPSCAGVCSERRVSKVTRRRVRYGR